MKKMNRKHLWKAEFVGGVAWSTYIFLHGKNNGTDIGGITILGSLAIVFLASSIVSLQRRWTADVIAAPPLTLNKSGLAVLDIIAFFLPFLGGGMILLSYKFAVVNFTYCSLLNVWGIYLIVLYSATAKRLRHHELEILASGRKDSFNRLSENK